MTARFSTDHMLVTITAWEKPGDHLANLPRSGTREPTHTNTLTSTTREPAGHIVHRTYFGRRGRGFKSRHADTKKVHVRSLSGGILLTFPADRARRQRKAANDARTVRR
jgi:hypothetical protein